MLSPADMLVVGVAALLFFGPDQLPKVARRAGQVVREVQATSASFIHEMERAADEPEHRTPYVSPAPYAAGAETVTIDQPAAPDHERYVDRDWQSHDLEPLPPIVHESSVTTGHEPAASNGEPHAPLVADSKPPKSESGSTEVNAPQSNEGNAPQSKPL